jgi:hypothetical protein
MRKRCALKKKISPRTQDDRKGLTAIHAMGRQVNARETAAPTSSLKSKRRRRRGTTIGDRGVARVKEALIYFSNGE